MDRHHLLMVETNVPWYCTNPVVTDSPSGSGEISFVFRILFGESDPIGYSLSEHFLKYILEIARCSRCLGIVGDAIHLRVCDKPAKADSLWSDQNNRCCFVTPPEDAEFRMRWSRERTRYRQYRRRCKLRNIPLPSDEILFELRNQQGNRCYYCFAELDNFSKDALAHIDHFQSVENGGTNSVFNLVFACSRCNRQKHSENGTDFINKWFPDRLIPSDRRNEIKRMRESVAEWRRQFSPKNLGNIERLVCEHAHGIRSENSVEFDEWCREGLRLLKHLEQVHHEKGYSSKLGTRRWWQEDIS